ncbi:MAG: phospho-sugar mutase, partial [Clostridia bacterium]|nr:phospho-sugar mutase [Clostridia bacterium]
MTQGANSLYTELFNLWLNNATADADLINELKSITDKSDEISDRFYTELEFGTAGLRGVIGAGTNRMNVYTVGRATQALAGYVKSVSEKPSVAIAYDSRIKSDLFAKTAASILAANGVKVYIYKELMPTPMLSFAVRRLKCDAGIVITESHNPAKYNGYNAYGSVGCQMPPDAANYILDLMAKIDYFKDIKSLDFEYGINAGTIEYIEQWLIDEYLDEVKKQSVRDKNIDLSSLKVIYTPLHGTGNKPVRAILDRIGIKNVTIVKEQELPDGNFPTAPYPNPEIKQPFELALAAAKSNDADLLLATDPDADRVGIAVKNGDEYTLISGNDVGAL